MEMSKNLCFIILLIFYCFILEFDFTSIIITNLLIYSILFTFNFISRDRSLQIGF